MVILRVNCDHVARSALQNPKDYVAVCGILEAREEVLDLLHVGFGLKAVGTKSVSQTEKEGIWSDSA